MEPNGTMRVWFRDYEETYLDGVQNELKLKKEQLFSLVKQPVIKGQYLEDILRETIRRFIPKRYSVVTGVVTCAGNNSSQLDIIIYDNNITYPIFFTENMVILPPEGVKIIIEVKTNKNSGNLDDAIDCLKSAIDLFNSSKQKEHLWTMIVFFNSPRDQTKIKIKCKENDIDLIYGICDKDGEIIKGEFARMLADLQSILSDTTEKNC